MVVQSFFTMGKKSTAQPRPKLHVPPRGIGPIAEPNENDVLCGRGGRINAHEGNVQFRDIVNANKKEYLAKSTKKLEKAHIAARIVEQIRSMDPPGRFLKEDPDGMWFDIGDAKAIKKAGQALREDAPDIRQELDGGSSGDEVTKAKTKKTKTPTVAKQAGEPTKKGGANTTNSVRNNRDGGGKARDGGSVKRQWASPGDDAFVVPSPRGGAYAAYPAFPAQRQRDVPPPYAAVGGNAPVYRGARNQPPGLTKQALESIHHPHPGVRGAAHLPPNHVAFGRNFTPTEISGGTMSTISGFSGVSGLSTTDTHMMGSALSLGSSGFGAPSLRASQVSGERMRPRSGQVSDLTHSFMSLSGLSRSPSFGELSAQGDISMSDASLKALMETGKGPSEFMSLAYTDASYSLNSGASARSNVRALQTHSAMSVASENSLVSSSLKSTGSGNSWLHPMMPRSGGSICSDDDRFNDDKSCLSDMSENILALDLARGM